MAKSGLEDILLCRFDAYIGLDYLQICDRLGIEPYQSKSKYADICGLIASEGVGKRLSKAEEFIKSGISVKTVRLRSNGMPKESISFKNIDYREVFENESWIDSELYEIFTGRFMFVVFRPVPGRKINIYNRKRGLYVEEDAYVLDKVFFWTMPASDLKHARVYWEQIRANVMANRIRLDAFWSISDGKKFHVRPKAALKTSKAENPHGGECDKYCYWFNADYVKEIIDSSGNEH